MKHYHLLSLGLVVILVSMLIGCTGTTATKTVTQTQSQTPTTTITPVTTTTLTATDQSIYHEIKNDVGGSFSHKDGLKIELPADSLYKNQDTLTIRKVEQPPKANTGSLEHVGEFYSIELENDDFFRGPVRIDLPYDENKLPSNRSEEEIFATFLADGAWYRIYGAVDTQRNVLSVYTIHNGFWSTAIDKVSNFTGDVAEFFNGRIPDLSDIEQARENVRLKRIEFLEAVEALQSMEDQTQLNIMGWTVQEFEQQVLVYGLTTGIAKYEETIAIAGKIVVGGETIGIWVALSGIAHGTFYLAAMAEEAGETMVFNTGRYISFISRLMEAEGIHYWFEHPEDETLPPSYKEALQDYLAALPIDQTISNTTPIDFNISAYPDQSTTTSPTTTSTPLTTTTTSTPTTTTPMTTTTPTTTTTITKQTTTQQPGSFKVLIDIDGLSPYIITIPKGSTVTWTNHCDEPRAISIGSYASSGNIMSGQSWSYTFTQAGRFEYHETLNSDMGVWYGTIIVE